MRRVQEQLAFQNEVQRRTTEFQNFINVAASNNYDGLLAVTDFIDDEKPLCVEINDDMKILGFADSSENFKLATGGIYYFSPSVLKEMDAAIENGMMRLRNFLKLLIEKDYNIHAYKFSKIIDVDHAQDIKAAEEFLRTK